MSKEERKAKFLERQRAITLADQQARGYVPPQPKQRKRRVSNARLMYGSQEWAETYRDDLGESRD